MKICVCGKGGCGKSTIVSLLATSFKRLGKKVLVLDSDESNNTLYRMMGFDHSPDALMDFAGGKQNVKKKMRSEFSAGIKEPEMSVWENGRFDIASIPSEYLCTRDGLTLMVTGKIHHALEGCACPMGSITREFVKNIVLNDNELMLVDTEAGIEHFGRGIEAGADCVISIVEPSLESISLAKRIKDLSIGSGTMFSGVVLNKLNSSQQKDIIDEKLNGYEIHVLGCIDYLSGLQDASLEGKPLHDLDCAADVTDEIALKLLQFQTTIS